MTKLNGFLKKIIILITLFLFIIMFFNATLHIGYLEHFNKVTNKTVIIQLLLSAIFMFTVLTIFNLINKFNEKQIKIFKYFLVGFILITQLVLIFNVKPTEFSDSLYVNDQARAIAKNIDKTFDYETIDYFKYYSNNNFCVLIVALITKLFILLELGSFSNYLALFNILMIDLGIIVLYKISALLKNEKFALKVLLLSVTNPLNILTSLWTYTCTYSIFFTIVIVLIYILLREKNYTFIKKIILTIVLGIIITCGYLLRPTSVFPIIAIIVYEFLQAHKSNVSIQNVKMKIILVFILIISTIFSFVLINAQLKKLSPYTTERFPIVHWIMMGLRDYGIYHGEDYFYTASFHTTNEKKVADIEVIKQRVNNLGIMGLVKHFSNKIETTWQSGASVYYIRIGGLKEESRIYDYVFNNKKEYFILYCQIYRIVIIFCTIIGMFYLLIQKKDDYSLVFIITLLGTIIFYLIWEGKDVYSIPFIQFMVFIAACGLEHLEKFKIKNKKMGKYIGIIIVLFTTLLFSNIYLLTREPELQTKTIVKNIFEYVKPIEISSNKPLNIKQTFYSKSEFNSITFLAYKTFDSKQKYEIAIYSNGKKLYSKTVTTKDIYDSQINLNFNPIIPKNKTQYIVLIKSKNNYKKQSIIWNKKISKATDHYKGNLYVNKINQKTDLVMNVNLEYYSPFISKKVFIISFIITIMSEIVLLLYYMNISISIKNLIKNIQVFYEKNKELINYLIFGVVTTIFSLFTYYLLVFSILNPKIGYQLQIANIISWIVGVAVAYVTNRKYVFESKNENVKKETIKFVSSRIFTLILDMLIMAIFVTLLKFNDKFFKLVSQVVITIGNYLLSKLFVFKK